MKTLDVIAAVLVVVGAANWGLVGMVNFDLVAMIFGMDFGQTSILSSVVYSLVGTAGLYQALQKEIWLTRCTHWGTSRSSGRLLMRRV